MADTKVTGLTENTTPVATDIMYMVDDPGSTPLRQKITLATLTTLINDVANAALWDAAGDLIYGTGANAGTRLAIGTANQLLRVNSGATAPEWASVGRVLIAENTPSGTATTTFTSIPATYKSLWIEWVGRTTTAAALSAVSLYFNNDTTDANYYRETRQGVDSTAGTQEAADALAVYLPGNTAPANTAGVGHAFIPDYAATTFNKGSLSFYGYRRQLTQQYISAVSLFWNSATAISRLDFVADGNYVAGTTFRLYGLF